MIYRVTVHSAITLMGSITWSSIFKVVIFHFSVLQPSPLRKIYLGWVTGEDLHHSDVPDGEYIYTNLMTNPLSLTRRAHKTSPRGRHSRPIWKWSSWGLDADESAAIWYFDISRLALTYFTSTCDRGRSEVRLSYNSAGTACTSVSCSRTQLAPQFAA